MDKLLKKIDEKKDLFIVVVFEVSITVISALIVQIII